MLKLKALKEEIAKLQALAKDVYQADRIDTIVWIRDQIKVHSLTRELLGFDESGKFVKPEPPPEKEETLPVKSSRKIVPRNMNVKSEVPSVVVAEPKKPLIDNPSTDEEGSLKRVPVEDVWSPQADFPYY